MDRQGVVNAIVEESVQAAQGGVIERFNEIAKERGFHEDDIGESRVSCGMGLQKRLQQA